MLLSQNTYDIPTDIVFLIGESRAGKDTVGSFFVKSGFQRVAFADQVKKEVSEIHKISLESLTEQGPLKEKYRPLLISHAESVRKQVPLYWLDKAFESHLDEQKRFKPGLKLVVTDCRRESEVDWIFDQKVRVCWANEEIIKTDIKTRHYLNFWLFLIEREEAKDTDVLTQRCIGYTQGIHKATKRFMFIDSVLKNNDTFASLEQRTNNLLKSFNLTNIYNKETT